MGPLLTRVRAHASAAAGALACVLAAAAAAADGRAAGDRHHVEFELNGAYVAASSPHGGWPDGGLGKLRFGEESDGLQGVRLLAAYRGRLTETLWGTLVADYVDDPSGGIGVTEAFLEWRPVPRSAIEQRVKVGAFYPPFSLENAERGWESPFTQSFSAVNTWLGEEVRPLGAEWSLRRRLSLGSPHELRAFAAAFYANDPAGTLLFWRGWSLHDRQTRLNDRLALPPAPVWSAGMVVGTRPQSLEPIDEIDGRPGAYAGVEWRYGRRALVQLAHYDNRADPLAFSAGQWGWDTSFRHVGVQITLPWDLGLVGQWLRGRTVWLTGGRPDGSRSPFGGIADDGFDARFAMLTRVFGGSHRVALRYDDFEIARDEAPPALTADSGHAWTVAYRYDPAGRLALGLEWLEIHSRRDPWSDFYALPRTADESQLRLSFEIELDAAH